MSRHPITRRIGPLVAVAVLAACGGGSTTNSVPGPATPDPSVAPTTADAAPEPATTPPVDEVADPGVPDGSVAVAPERQQSITVGGMGAEYWPPERSVIDIGVSVRRDTVDAATRDAAAAAAALAGALTAEGVPADGIQTSQFGIQPWYDQYDYTRIVGYETNIGYRVTIPEVGMLGDVLARAVQSGGDSVRAWSVRFEGDPAGHMEVARAAAWNDVRARAAATAAEAGEPLGVVLDVHEKVLVTSPQGMWQGGEGDAVSFDIPVSPGVVGVVVLLTVTFAIGE